MLVSVVVDWEVEGCILFWLLELVLEKCVFGLFVFGDSFKDGVVEVVEVLCGWDIYSYLIIGDNCGSVVVVVKVLGIDDVYVEVLLVDKVVMVVELKGWGWVVVMVGDGINDVLVLVVVDVGIVMGGGIDVVMYVVGIILMCGDLCLVLVVLDILWWIYVKIC